MPALVRRLLIWAAADGLILQAHGPFEHHKSIHIDYANRQITELPSTGAGVGASAETRRGNPLEAHGIIGRSNSQSANEIA